MLTKATKIFAALLQAATATVEKTPPPRRDKPQRPSINPRLARQLRSYDWILVNSSAGKDSQAMLDYVVACCDSAGVARSKIVVVHADLGRVEWQGTRDLARRQAEHYKLRFIVVKRPKGDLLAYVRRRKRWPGPSTRYCTSDFKRAQVQKVMTQLTREAGLSGRKTRQCRILNCMGLRAQESASRTNCSGPKGYRCKKGRLAPMPGKPAPRAGELCSRCGGSGKQKAWEHNSDASTQTTRCVDQWLPIHKWTTEQVWDRIRQSGVEHHKAYDLGMPRLSCCFCIYAPREALILAGKHNLDLLREYAAVEAEINHTFRQELTLAEILEAVERGEDAGSIKEWGDM